MGIIIKNGVVYSGGGGGGSGTSNYPELTNKPKINNVTLIGNKTASDLHLVDEDDELTITQINTLKSLL